MITEADCLFDEWAYGELPDELYVPETDHDWIIKRLVHDAYVAGFNAGVVEALPEPEGQWSNEGGR